MQNSQFDHEIHVENLVTLSKAKAFLGREFLVWLWYTAENESEGLELKGIEKGRTTPVELWIDDKTVLESPDVKGHTNSIKGGHPSQSLEAAAALRSGRIVRELKVGLRIGDHGEFTAVLGSDGFSTGGLSPKSLVLPPCEEGEDGTGGQWPLATRLDQTELFLKVLDGLFGTFIEKRTSDGWEKDGFPGFADG